MSKNENRIDKFLEYLSSKEVEKANKFLKHEDRIRCILTRSFLKKLLSLYLNKSISDICFNYNNFDKPYLNADINSLDLQFNVSHSYDLIIFSFTLYDQIGVDIEKVKSINELKNVAKSFFSDQEYKEWEALIQDQKLSSFFDLWTCKEAVIKTLGTGLSYNTKNFTINNLKNTKRIIFHDNKMLNTQTLWTIQNIHLKNIIHYRAAFATQKKVSEVCFFDLVEENILEIKAT